ncbi:MAG: hypothetical protein Q7R43_00815, partial [Candidatus Daviesbacteria bacterium]|nr:hypothetical protein [Candidatus Daviesbacteria bacterium]
PTPTTVPSCEPRVFQYNQCIGVCNVSQPVYRDSCGNWPTGPNQVDSACNSYTYCQAQPTPTPIPGDCTYSACGGSCSPNQRYISGSACPPWYTGPGCYLDNGCPGPGSGSSPPAPPARVQTCLRVSKTDPGTPPDCNETEANNQENSPIILTLAPGELFYAQLFFKPIGLNLQGDAKAEIFFKEPNITPSLQDATRYCWNPKWEGKNPDRMWLPDLVNHFSGGGAISGKECRNPAPLSGWIGIDGNWPCHFANQPLGDPPNYDAWNYQQQLSCTDDSTGQYNESWGNIGGSDERLGNANSPSRYIVSSVNCNGVTCDISPNWMADGSVYKNSIPIRVIGSDTTKTIKFRGALVEKRYVDPTGYLGPVVNPALCNNMAANFTERTPKNGWGAGGGTPYVPPFGACHAWGENENFYFFSNWVTIKIAGQKDAACVSNNIPTTMTQGVAYPGLQVTMKNTGTSAWTSATNFKLGEEGSKDPPYLQRWGVARALPIVGSVAPGANYTFTFTETPASFLTVNATYANKWQMLKEGVAWFGETCGPNTKVNPAPTPQKAWMMIYGDVHSNK